VTAAAGDADVPLHLHGDAIARGAALDFAVNVAAGSPPDWLRAALERALREDVGAYPDERPAVEAIAARHRRDPDEVVLLNGAAQGFWLVAGLQPRRPVCVHPSFTEPEVALAAAGRPPRRVVLEPPWTLDPAAIPADADLVVLGNPTNPTGVLHPRAAVAALTAPGRIVLVDEAFMDFVPGEPESLADADAARASDAAPDAARLPGLVVLRSLTKLHAIPGLRAGYLLAPPALARRLRDARPGWSVNALALAAIRAIAEHPQHAPAIAAQTARDRDDLVTRLRDTTGALALHPSHANFVLAEHPDGAALLARLRDAHGIALRPCHSFPGLSANYLRIAVRTPAHHARLAHAIARETGAGA
jgi:histidinol-phosphate/aromatic aminotransferase/cobyric acid decarboxylase-like protein